jgi:hypothetical protein
VAVERAFRQEVRGVDARSQPAGEVRIEVSAEDDGALAVVDIDTLWRDEASGDDAHWLGRTCKRYALVGDGWKMTAQVGALRY